MNPAPATSTFAIVSSGGSASISASASRRGFWRAGFASRIARLLAKSPKDGSRVRSTSIATSRQAPGTRSSGSAASARCNRFSINFFTREPTITRNRKGRQFTRKSSIDFERIDVDRPAQARAARAGARPAAASRPRKRCSAGRPSASINRWARKWSARRAISALAGPSTWIPARRDASRPGDAQAAAARRNSSRRAASRASARSSASRAYGGQCASRRSSKALAANAS